MSAVEEFTGGLSQPEEEGDLAVAPVDHADVAPEGHPHTAELELPTSTHTARSSSPSLSEVPSAGLSTLSLDSFSVGDNSPVSYLRLLVPSKTVSTMPHVCRAPVR